MNVDEAMAIAVKRFGWPFKYEHHSNPSIISHAVLAEEVNRLMGEAYFQAEANKGLIAELAEKKAENDRLHDELAQLRKDWCDDDEAIKQQALRVLPKFEVEGDSVHVPRMGELAEMMADTALRYKEEGLAWMMAAQDKERELAAAKAASVVPVKIADIYDGEWTTDTYIECDTTEDCDKFREWLRDRMKERGEGQQ